MLDEVNGVASLIKYFVMSYENPNLNNLSILDTPGFTSNDREDANRTLEVINECDALFWVFDVNNGTINKSSLAVIKENLRKPLYIIINKVDSKAPSEVKEVEQLITETFKEEGIDYKDIIRFSQKTDVNTIMDIIKSVEPDKSTEGYLDGIQDNLHKLTTEIEEICDELKKNINESEDKVEENKDSIENIKSIIDSSCHFIKNTPIRKERLFKGITFEMNEKEATSFFNMVDLISDDNSNYSVAKLIKEANRLVENTKELQKKQTKLSEHKQKQRVLRQCEEDLEKLRKKIVTSNKTTPSDEYYFNNEDDIEEYNLIEYM